jgi:hypothetical protein
MDVVQIAAPPQYADALFTSQPGHLAAARNGQFHRSHIMTGQMAKSFARGVINFARVPLSGKPR